MSNEYLMDIVDDIEENNQRYFHDPFYSLNSFLQEINYDFFRDNALNERHNYNLELSRNMEQLYNNLEDISDQYQDISIEYNKWRIKGFEKVLFTTLSNQSLTISKLVLDILYTLDSYKDETINFDEYLNIKSIYKDVMLMVYRSSRGLSTYQLDNLWE